MLLSTKFPLVLRLQLNEQQKLKAVRVCWIDSTVKCELVGVQIDTGLLVKGSVWNWQYGKVWGCGTADWYSVVGED